MGRWLPAVLLSSAPYLLGNKHFHRLSIIPMQKDSEKRGGILWYLYKNHQKFIGVSVPFDKIETLWSCLRRRRGAAGPLCDRDGLLVGLANRSLPKWKKGAPALFCVGAPPLDISLTT